VEIIYQRVAGIDVGQKEVAVTVRIPATGPGAPRVEVTRKFKTLYPVLAVMAASLTELGVTHGPLPPRRDRAAGTPDRVGDNRAGPRAGLIEHPELGEVLGRITQERQMVRGSLGHQATVTLTVWRRTRADRRGPAARCRAEPPALSVLSLCGPGGAGGGYPADHMAPSQCSAWLKRSSTWPAAQQLVVAVHRTAFSELTLPSAVPPGSGGEGQRPRCTVPAQRLVQDLAEAVLDAPVVAHRPAVAGRAAVDAEEFRIASWPTGDLLPADKLLRQGRPERSIGSCRLEGSMAGDGLPLRVPSTRVTVTGSAFELCTLNWGGAKGTRTPGLLPAVHGESVRGSRVRSVSRTSGHIAGPAAPGSVRRSLSP
jgi:hypothetical protein